MTRLKQLAELGLRPARFRAPDLAAESLRSILGHPGRSLLTAVGTVLGAAAFVATLGISTTLTQQVSDSFDLRRATEVVVQPADGGPRAAESPPWLSDTALARLRGLNGVESAGRRMLLPEMTVARSFGPDKGAPTRIIGIDAGAAAAIEPRIILGRGIDTFHDDHRQRVALLPAGIAKKLAIDRVGVAIFIEDRPYLVIGIFDDVQRRPEVLAGVVIPYGTAAAFAGATAVTRDVIIKTAPGAAALIGAQAPLALSPGEPGALDATAPPDPKTLRREVESNVLKLSMILSLVALAVGAISIGNAATAQIGARVGEIGLRRAVGARPVHIFAQLTGETTLLGTAGGLIGSVMGLLVTVAVSLWNGWQPVIDLPLAVLAVAGGAAAGLVAGLVPAWRATRIQPVAALQR
ncbi:ABC transporter related [Alloactinosynnema sp. L-07]|uniref:ABC transporter permease n=1 Tax=Alloactinosynnema sp. L-07 TaxID=1653480 RepID=UPI00065EFD5D|nr:ABC transporter permease [Alloactinosynnema sp. L-07]CRK60010.1 ABC transporter related [Alloactinosynnema sp. L-07]